MGLLFVAIGRGTNDAYIALVALTIAGLVLALLVGWYRRTRYPRSGDRLSDVDGHGGGRRRRDVVHEVVIARTGGGAR
ncbi:hypothetical protein PV646_20555 [Streptomyces sp. ID05-26A]|nr:hypothetical protein [Streptomyces sp. ID05-26A]